VFEGEDENPDEEQKVSLCGCKHNKPEKGPFCDGSHKGTEFTPQGWEAPKTGKVFFCACKRTGKSPMCDGSHNAL
jgi:CDGSH-type Zn-finger protein